ncbi:MAG: dCTP deaminase [Thermoanaerobaculia bacterium]|nr:dCTP deaminase [Thermoanaerobaculia bacterium]
MTVLSAPALEKRLRDATASGLVITPLLSARQVGEGSVDVRLGNEFLLPTRVLSGHVTYQAVPKEKGRLFDNKFKLLRLDFGRPLFVHPHQLVLGATLEFVKVPDDLACYVIGRSSLGRTGLVIATATAVAPGFGGCITLEIVNAGEIPLPLFPGMRIAQLVFHGATGGAEYNGRFQCSVGPEPPLLSRDREMDVWNPSGI